MWASETTQVFSAFAVSDIEGVEGANEKKKKTHFEIEEELWKLPWRESEVH